MADRREEPTPPQVPQPFAAPDAVKAVGADRWLPWLGAAALIGWAAFVIVEYRERHRHIVVIDAVADAPVSSFLAALVVVLAATSLGEFLLHRFFGPRKPAERMLTGFAIGSGTLAWIVFVFGNVGLLSPFTVWPLILLAIGVGLRPLLADARSLARSWPSRIPAAAVALGFLALLLLLHSMAPPNEWDELAYHLPIPLRAAETGRFPLAGHDFSYYPQLCESLTAAGLLLGGAISVGRVIHYCFALALAGTVFLVSRELLPENRKAAWLAIFVLAVEPTFVATAPIAGIDLALSFFALQAVWLLQRDGLRRTMFLAGILGGFACGTSYRGLVAAVALGSAAVAARRARLLWAIALAGVVAAAPWYVRNLVASGNPVYPYLRSVFPTTPLPTGFGALGWPMPELHLTRNTTQAPEDLGQRVAQLVRLPWDATIMGRSNTLGRFGADISPLYLAVAPALALVRFCAVPRGVLVWGAYAVVHSLVWAITPSSQGTRYEMSVFAAFAIVLPILFHLLRARALRLVANGITGVFCALLYAGALLGINPIPDVLYVGGRMATADYLDLVNDAPLHRIVRALNAEPPTAGPVLMIGEKRTLYIERPVIPDFDIDNVGALYRNGGKTPEGMAALLRRSGIRHILEHSGMAHDRMTPEEEQAYDQMVTRYMETRAQARGYLVWRSLRE